MTELLFNERKPEMAASRLPFSVADRSQPGKYAADPMHSRERFAPFGKWNARGQSTAPRRCAQSSERLWICRQVVVQIHDAGLPPPPRSHGIVISNVFGLLSARAGVRFTPPQKGWGMICPATDPQPPQVQLERERRPRPALPIEPISIAG